MSKSDRIGMLYYVCRTRQFIAKNSFNLALKEAMSFKNLINKSKILNTNSNLIRINHEIAKIQVQLKKYTKAHHFAKEALVISKNGMLYELKLFESLFIISLHSEDFENANLYLSQAKNHPIVKSNENHKNRWLLYNAFLNFKESKFSHCFKILASLSKKDIKTDVYGWELSFRLLEIMAAFELNKFELAASKVHALQKHIIRHSVKHKRLRLIYAVLKALSKKVDYKSVYKKYKNDIDSLKGGNNTFYWDPFGFELIRFDTWIKHKAKS